MTSAEPARDNCTKQSPPMPVEPASTTHWTAHAVTAASIALPPSRSASTAARVAAAWDVAAMPLLATVSDRPGSSKFRMMFDFILRGPFQRAARLAQLAGLCPPTVKKKQFTSRAQHLDSHFNQMIADRLRSRDRVTSCERRGDFTMLILVALPERRVRVALFDLQPRALVANANDGVIDPNSETIMCRRDQIAMEGAIPMLPLLQAAGAIAAFESFHDEL